MILNKHTLGGLFGLIYFGGAVMERMTSLHILLPDQYPANLMALLQPWRYPLCSIYAIAPVLFALSIYYLYQFSLSSRMPSTGAFTPESLKALRFAGLCICSGAAALALEIIVAQRFVGPHLPAASAVTNFLFIVIGGALAAISRSGSTLLDDRHKLRSELDEIV